MTQTTTNVAPGPPKRNPARKSRTGSARVEARSQGLLVRAGTNVPWTDVVSGERVDVVTRSYPYNVRPVRVADGIEIWGVIPPQAEVQRERRAWLTEQVERAARATDRRPKGRVAKHAAKGESADVLASAHSAHDDADNQFVTSSLEMISGVAEDKGWAVRSIENQSRPVVELLPDAAGSRAGCISLRPDGRCTLLACEILPFASSESEYLNPVLLVAVLALNARCAFARLRVHDDTAVRVEHLLPAAGLNEDEVSYALEGVRFAFGEATRVFRILRDHAVAREYAAINGIALRALGAG